MILTSDFFFQKANRSSNLVATNYEKEWIKYFKVGFFANFSMYCMDFVSR